MLCWHAVWARGKVCCVLHWLTSLLMTNPWTGWEPMARNLHTTTSKLTQLSGFQFFFLKITRVSVKWSNSCCPVQFSGFVYLAVLKVLPFVHFCWNGHTESTLIMLVIFCDLLASVLQCLLYRLVCSNHVHTIFDTSSQLTSSGIT